MTSRDLDGARSALSFASEAERELWARLAESAFAHGLRTHGSLEESVAAAIAIADRLVVELRERSVDLPRVEALHVPATEPRVPSSPCARCGADPVGYLHICPAGSSGP